MDDQDLKDKLEEQERTMNEAKKKLMEVKLLKQKLNKAFEMLSRIKEKMNEADIEKEIDSLI